VIVAVILALWCFVHKPLLLHYLKTSCSSNNDPALVMKDFYKVFGQTNGVVLANALSYLTLEEYLDSGVAVLFSFKTVGGHIYASVGFNEDKTRVACLIKDGENSFSVPPITKAQNTPEE